MWQIKPSNLSLYINSQLRCSSSVLNLSIWKCIAHNLDLCCLLQNWMNTWLMGLERDRSMAMLYEPFGSGQTLWDWTPLSLAVTMGLCDRLNVLFSEWCGSLVSDNGFTLHRLFPEALHVTRPLLFAPFWTNCAASTHLQQFWIWDLFVLLSATLKWKWLDFAWNMSSYCLFATQVRYNPVCVLKLSFILIQRRLCE